VRAELRRLATALLCLVLGCSHAQTVASPTSPSPKEAPTRLPPSSAVTPESEPGHPALASSPGQLLAPGAADAIAEALRKRGLLSATASSKELEAALRTFQESQGLAATGFPDHETLRKLGIDPGKVDRTDRNADAGP
jgi:hypothetical protein